MGSESCCENRGISPRGTVLCLPVAGKRVQASRRAVRIYDECVSL